MTTNKINNMKNMVPIENSEKVTLKDVYKVIENKGWDIHDFEQDGEICLEISQYSPAGENFFFTIFFDGTISDLKHNISDYVYSFDRDEHVRMHLGMWGNDTSGLPSISVLVENAKDIETSLEELSRKVIELSIKGATLKDAYEVIENDGWSISENKSDYEVELEISQYSSAGEDFNFSIYFDGTINDLRDKIYDYSYCFDVDEHVEGFLALENSGTPGRPSVSKLVEDSDDIFEMLRELEAAVNHVIEN